MKKFLRNFLLILLATIVLAIIFTHSQKARTFVTPAGVPLPPGIPASE